MAEETKKEWVDNFNTAIGGVSPQNGNTGGGEQGTPDKYKTLENTSFKELLNSKIQASAAKEQAQKYMVNSLNASGMAGQGMAESTKAGIYGNYMKAINEADATHSANMNDIAMQKANDMEAKGTDRFQSAMEMIKQARSKTDLDLIKKDFYDSFDDDQKKYFDYYYATYASDLADTNVKLGSKYVYSPDADIPCYDRSTGGTTTEKGEFDIENQNLNSAIAQGEIAKGSYIQLANLKGQSIFLYYGNDGQLYYMNKTEYEKAEGAKRYIYGKENTIHDGIYK